MASFSDKYNGKLFLDKVNNLCNCFIVDDTEVEKLKTADNLAMLVKFRIAEIEKRPKFKVKDILTFRMPDRFGDMIVYLLND